VPAAGVGDRREDEDQDADAAQQQVAGGVEGQVHHRAAGERHPGI
jgi:hypothetical protein